MYKLLKILLFIDNVEIYIFLYTFESTSKELLIFVICITNKGNKNTNWTWMCHFGQLLQRTTSFLVSLFLLYLYYSSVLCSPCAQDLNIAWKKHKPIVNWRKSCEIMYLIFNNWNVESSGGEKRHWFLVKTKHKVD